MRDQIEGSAKELKGEAKQKVAKVTGNPEQKVEGAIDRAEGRFQQKTGQIKRDVMRE